MMILRSFLLLFSGLLAAFSPITSAKVGSEAIKSSVSLFMAKHIALVEEDYGGNVRIEFTISQLDSRLTMQSCPQPLTVKLKSQNTIGRINVRVSCQEKNVWSLYVPVEVDLFRPVVAAVMPVAKGTQLGHSQLEMREMNVGKLNGTYYTDISTVIGMQAKRNIRADKPIIAGYLEPPLMVKKGDSVQMTAQSGGLMVRIPGIALSDGQQGQQISVRNSQSNRVVEAKVSSHGQVIIAM
jgi:flagella basal body P-ring formation protein FlgA